jgi:hypothetical protein
MPRFAVFVKGDTKPGQMPSEEALDEMGRFNEELVKAGVMLAGDGLHPSAEGVRIRYSEGGKATVTDGPFAESKELVAGFWILQAKSQDEIIEWLKRAPFRPSPEFEGDPEVEIRQIFELDEFLEGPAIDRARELQKQIDEQRG